MSKEERKKTSKERKKKVEREKHSFMGKSIENWGGDLTFFQLFNFTQKNIFNFFGGGLTKMAKMQNSAE